METLGMADAILIWLAALGGYLCFPDTAVALAVDSHVQLE